MSRVSPNSRRRLGSTLAALRRGEWEALARNLLERTVPPWLLYFNRLRIGRLRELADLREPLDPIAVREAGPGDIPSLRRIHDRGGDFQRKFDLGHRCFLAESRGAPAAMVWFEPGPVHRSRENAFDYRLGEGACWVYWVEVVPACRGRGALAALWSEALRRLRAEGTRAVYCLVVETNPAVIRSHRRLGFEEIGRFSVIRFLGLTLHRHVDHEGRVHLGLGRWVGAPPAAR